MVEPSNSYDLRSRACELLRVPDELALTDSVTVGQLRRVSLFCDLLRIPQTAVFRRTISAAILDKGIAATISSAPLSDRILSCRDPPAARIVDLRESRDTAVFMSAVGRDADDCVKGVAQERRAPSGLNCAAALPVPEAGVE